MPSNDYDLAYAVNLTPENAVKYFQSKGLAKSFNWYELWQEQHHKAFTVAKAMSFDLLNDIRKEVQKAIDTGVPLEQFKKNLEPTLKKLGWWGKQYMFDESGELKLVQLGSPRRLETIYDVNLSVAYSTGRYKELIDNADERPYWQYFDVDDISSRPEHMLLHKKVWRWDDAIWDRIYPPNDWRCRCWVRGLTKAQIDSKGFNVEKAGFKLPEGFQPDEWAYNPGATNIGLDVNAWKKIREYESEDLRREAVNFMARSNETRKEVFNNFVNNVLKDKQTRGRNAVAGWMDSEIIDHIENIENEKAFPVITITDEQMIKIAGKKSISFEELKNIPEYLRDPKAVLRAHSNEYLYVYGSEVKDERIVVWLKYNAVNSVKKYKISELKDYKLIKGKL